MTRHGGQILADQLAIQGVRATFTVPGESFLAALAGLHDKGGIQTIICRQEGGAAMMADAWAKATGETGEHHVSVASRGGETTVTASANISTAAVLAYVPPSALATVLSIIGFAVSANDANQLGMMLSLAIVPTALGAARTLFGRFSRSQARALEAAVEEVARLVQEGDQG